MRLSDHQWLVLWELDDHPGAVWRRDDKWFITGSVRDHNITMQIKALMVRGLVELTPGTRDTDDPLRVTQAGRVALSARDHMDVLRRHNGR